MPKLIAVPICASAALSACQTTTSGSTREFQGVPNNPGGLAPTHGRTPEQRARANAYYHGPRGDEF